MKIQFFLLILSYSLFILCRSNMTTFANFSVNLYPSYKETIKEYILPENQKIWKITVKMGDGFLIKIFSNPTRGYNWYIDNIDEMKDSHILSCINLNVNLTGKFIINRQFPNYPGFFEFKFSSVYKQDYITYNRYEKIIFIEKRQWEDINFRVVETRIYFR